MKPNTILGALIAAGINFLTAITTLFANDMTMTFSVISQAAWVSMVGGMLIQFLKDYQAISTRRMVNNVTKSGDGGI